MFKKKTSNTYFKLNYNKSTSNLNRHVTYKRKNLRSLKVDVLQNLVSLIFEQKFLRRVKAPLSMIHNCGIFNFKLEFVLTSKTYQIISCLYNSCPCHVIVQKLQTYLTRILLLSLNRGLYYMNLCYY